MRGANTGNNLLFGTRQKPAAIVSKHHTKANAAVQDILPFLAKESVYITLGNNDTGREALQFLLNQGMPQARLVEHTHTGETIVKLVYGSTDHNGAEFEKMFQSTGKNKVLISIARYVHNSIVAKTYSNIIKLRPEDAQEFKAHSGILGKPNLTESQAIDALIFMNRYVANNH